MKVFFEIPCLVILALSLTMCATAPEKAYEAIDVGHCISCHQERTPGLFQSWVNSKHAKKGVHCVTCHIDHEAAFERKAMVSPEKCGECHKKELVEFQQSRHSLGWDRMRVHGEYLGIPQEIRSAFCERCHIVQKRCNSCHSSHSFSLKEAREPDSCGSCHLGPDHPHKEMYETSLHGIVYKLTGDPERAPRCITCHMPGGTHNSSFGIAKGPVGTKPDVVDLKQVPIPEEEQKKRREGHARCLHRVPFRKIRQGRVGECRSCKGGRLRVAGRGKKIVEEAGTGGLLSPSLAERMPHPTEGRSLVLSDPQLYIGTSYIERLFFTMFKFHSIRVWKSGYHFSPAYTHGFGWSEMQLDLIDIKEEANKLREMLKKEKK